MRGAMLRPIAIAAGGTGGHLYPAEAVVQALAARGQRPVLLTDRRSLGRLGPGFCGIETHVLAGEGIAGRGVWRLPGASLSLARGVVQARALLAGLAPAALVAFGGYPSVPPVLAARTLAAAQRPRIVLHEQNGVLGRANRALSRVADLIALSLPQTARVPAGAATAVLGNPVRPAIAALAGGGYRPPDADGPIRLVVVGGSLGARVFADLVPPALALLPEQLRSRIDLTLQARAEDLDRTRRSLAQAKVAARVAPFLDDMPALYRSAHLVIARAGASTVAELACVGRPALLVPLPGAIDQHQEANARALADAGAAELLRQAALTPQLLAQRLAALCDDPSALAAMAAAAASLARPDAAESLAEAVLALARTEAG